MAAPSFQLLRAESSEPTWTLPFSWHMFNPYAVPLNSVFSIAQECNGFFPHPTQPLSLSSSLAWTLLASILSHQRTFNCFSQSVLEYKWDPAILALTSPPPCEGLGPPQSLGCLAFPTPLQAHCGSLNMPGTHLIGLGLASADILLVSFLTFFRPLLRNHL